jgi:hypothetical protein
VLQQYRTRIANVWTTYITHNSVRNLRILNLWYKNIFGKLGRRHHIVGKAFLKG